MLLTFWAGRLILIDAESMTPEYLKAFIRAVSLCVAHARIFFEQGHQVGARLRRDLLLTFVGHTTILHPAVRTVPYLVVFSAPTIAAVMGRQNGKD